MSQPTETQRIVCCTNQLDTLRCIGVYAVLSPLLFRWIYSMSVSWMPGLVWFTESALFLLGFGCFFALPDWTKPINAENSGLKSLGPSGSEETELVLHSRFRGEE